MSHVVGIDYSTNEITLTIPGVPAPQGSKTRTRWGVREDNPNTKPWRNAVAAYALEAIAPAHPLAGPCELDVVFVFPRPKSHYRTGKLAGQLKPSAPIAHAGKPDLDKLLRAIGDALTGIIVQDDAQFAVIRASKKYGLPGATVTVRPIAFSTPEAAQT